MNFFESHDTSQKLKYLNETKNKKESMEILETLQ